MKGKQRCGLRWPSWRQRSVSRAADPELGPLALPLVGVSRLGQLLPKVRLGRPPPTLAASRLG